MYYCDKKNIVSEFDRELHRIVTVGKTTSIHIKAFSTTAGLESHLNARGSHPYYLLFVGILPKLPEPLRMLFRINAIESDKCPCQARPSCMQSR